MLLDDPGVRYRHKAIGLSILSDIRLPFPPDSGTGKPDVEIVAAPLTTAEADTPARFSGSNSLVVSNLPGVARYRIRGGREVIVEAVPDARAEDVLFGLVGACFGVLALQRGLLPLHASTIQTEQGCVAFVGRSAAGKSTLAAFFARLGYSIVSDDLLVIGFDCSGRAIAWPHAPQLRLWGSSLSALGEEAAALIPVRRGVAKFYFDADPPSAAGPIPLDRIYRVDARDFPGEHAIETLRGLTALQTLMRHCHGWGPAAEVIDGGEQMATIARLLGKVPLYSLKLRRGFDYIEREVKRIESHFSPPAVVEA